MFDRGHDVGSVAVVGIGSEGVTGAYVPDLIPPPR